MKAPIGVKNVFLSAAALVIFLLLLEIPFRVYDYGYKYRSLEERIGQENVGLLFQEIIVYTMKRGIVARDPDLIWRHRKFKTPMYEFNSLGIRTMDGHEPTPAKDSQTFRIIVLGGSHPFGMGVRFEETYSSRLEEPFKRERQKWEKRVEVINASVPGHSSVQVLGFLRHEMIRYKPDLIIIDVGNNDGIELDASYPWKDSEMVGKSPMVCNLLNVAERSSFFWYFREVILWGRSLVRGGRWKEAAGQSPPSVRVPLEENLRNIEEIKRTAVENGSKVLFLTQMMLTREGRLVKGYGNVIPPYIDVYAEFQLTPDISEYFVDEIHGSAKGHAKIAELIYNYLVSDEVTRGNRKAPTSK